ncbi:MAG: hypothetical protein K6G83_15835 [Lachnospiraceae bacterium]|nr:hypothetical protein [Lachnospiraceae bacterium]
MEFVRKEAEKLIGFQITDDAFDRAYIQAECKQMYIYLQTEETMVLEPWYLAQLIAEYVKSNAFSEFTIELSRALSNMEKEHSFQRTERPKALPIVSVSAQ